MQINGLIKTSLVDYPGQLVATLFTGGCNMRCPFCHNSHLVAGELPLEEIPEETLFNFLRKRQGTLDGVCITGGEPTLQPDLISFLRKLRELSIKIKLDTNGLNPDLLSLVLEEQLVDYVAMDIKNCPDKYALTAGVSSISIEAIEASIQILKNCPIDYEFRTTVVQEFHTLEDLKRLALWLKGTKKYVLQRYQSSPHQLLKVNYKAYSLEEMLAFKKVIEPYFGIVEVRGY